MVTFPYTTVDAKLKPLLEKIQQVGVPDKTSVQWLGGIGFKSSNDRTLLPVLKFIGLTDQSGKPTAKWSLYRDKRQAGKALAEGVKKGYHDLFQTYPNANQSTEDDLRSFFGSKSRAGERVITQIVKTFRALGDLSDFGSLGEEFPEPQAPSAPQKDKAITSKRKVKAHDLGSGVTVNINIQLTLPDTKDKEVYEALFEALKKNLLS